MRIWNGTIKEIRLGTVGRLAWIDCPPAGVPAAGQYMLGWSPVDLQAPLASVVFPAQTEKTGFLAAAQVPESWEPGSHVILQGPLGHGFNLPAGINRLVLAALDITAERLLAILPMAVSQGCEVAVCADCLLPRLPEAVEILPLEQLDEIIPWADYLLFDLPGEKLDLLRVTLQRKNHPAGQALIARAMPCGGNAGCGACAIPGNPSPMLVCRDGPVFPLHKII